MTVTKKFIHESDLLNSLHGPFFPSDIRSGEKVKATVELKESGKTQEMKIWRMSPLGIELVNDQSAPIKQGENVNVTLVVGDQITRFDGLIVDLIETDTAQKVIGIRLTSNRKPANIKVEKRKFQRWVTVDQFLPTGMAPNPVKFNDFIFFRVKDISATGMQVITSLRNKFILPGMVFDTTISFPMISQVRVRVKVQNIRITTNLQSEYLSLGVEFIENNTELNHSISQYIAQFTDVQDIQALHKDGLSPRSLKNTVKFSFVKTEEEYKDVLNLRYLANKHEGKLSEGTNPEDMADIFDTRSRIIIGKIGKKTVASARMTFSEHDQELEHESYIDWTNDLPRRDESIEIMRACTHPEYQGNDLFFLMWKFMGIPIAQSGRRWIVMSTTEKYYKMYKKMGGASRNIFFKIPAFKDTDHQLIIGNVKDGLLGRGMDPIVWNYLYGDLFDYLKADDLYDLTPIDRLRLLTYRALTPLSNLIVNLFVIPKRIERSRMKALKDSHAA